MDSQNEEDAMKASWLLSVGALAVATPVFAQDASQDTLGDNFQQGDIVVTATRRASPLSDVPIAVSAITAESLQYSGASDIRQLNQLSPSLLVSSSSTEATGGGARIRGIGTVGDNPGLESSVATFIDGVYRSRSGVGLTELGPIERIEVLRGPQGTLFGRNASAGLINIVTARPKFQDEGWAEAGYGNYNQYRFGGGVTGPIGESVAYRIDGLWTKRDGFMKDVVSGRDINDRKRWLVRGKLLMEPSDALSVLISADYAKRNEECCVGAYLPVANVTRNADGTLTRSTSSVAQIIRSMTSVVPGAGRGIVNDDTFSREVAITPGQDYQSNVRDAGVSAEINYDLGGARLTSISAYRDWNYVRGQDADFNNLDILRRDSDGDSFTRFKTFTQELRLQGEAFEGKLDWLIGGYYARETLNLGENTHYGADYDAFITRIVQDNGSRQTDPVNRALLTAFPGYKLLQPFSNSVAMTLLTTNPAFAAVPAAARSTVANLATASIQNVPLSGTGQRDSFHQTSRNYALFTHNIVNVTDRLALTLGARYTNEKKTLDASLVSDSGCGVFMANIATLRAQAAANGANPGGNGGLNQAVAGLQGALATQVLPAIAAGACGAISGINGDFSSRKKEGEWSGTAVASYRATDDLMTYASYARGYKAGGFNLDRAPLDTTATSIETLKFQPEKVDAFEVGFKFDGRKFDVNVAAFYQLFKSFQLNTFNGSSFFVTDIRGCKDSLGTRDSDQIAGNSQCANTRSGVVSKGVEVEAFLYPVRDVTMALGFTYADTRYRSDLSGTADPITGDNSLQPALSLLPGGRLSNSSQYVVTGSSGWTPELSGNLRGLIYADFRYTSELNSGSDLFTEKEEPGNMVVNARLGITGIDKQWSLEFWGQNIFNVRYSQIRYNMPLQGGGGSAGQLTAGGTTSQLFGAFLADPRTYGVTVRTKF